METWRRVDQSLMKLASKDNRLWIAIGKIRIECENGCCGEKGGRGSGQLRWRTSWRSAGNLPAFPSPIANSSYSFKDLSIHSIIASRSSIISK